MKRNLAKLSAQGYDLLVIGGGIYGVCIAWDAALRGLSVALVEKRDWGHATSANSLRVIHGGLRYLQHGDIYRTRRSLRERAIFMRIAPHLIKPLPIIIPTYGHGLRGKEILSLALSVENILRSGLTLWDEAPRSLPKGEVLSRAELLRLLPITETAPLTGGVRLYECQMPSSERVVLSFAQSAAQAGAQLANYVAVTNFIRQGNYVTGVQAQDFLSGNELAIRSKLIINATGPWLDETLAPLTGHRPSRILQFSKAFNLLISRQIASGYAVGLYSRKYFRDTDALLQKGARLLFIIPWYGGSLIGTAHCFHRGDPENLTVSDEEVALFLDEINDAYPAAKLTRDDVSYVYGGLLPATNHGIGGVQLVKRHRIYDHIQDGISGLISVNGVKFTEARYVAEKTVDLALKKLGRRPIRSTTAVTPLYGGRMDVIELHRDGAARRDRLPLDGDMVQDLIFHYGSAYPEVVKYLDSRSASTHDGSNRLALIKAQIQYGVQEEMAQTLADIVFRRIMLARSGHPGAAHLRTCALVMAQELGWAPTKTEEEIKHVEAILRSHHAFDYLLDSKVLQPWRERDNDERHSVAISHV